MAVKYICQTCGRRFIDWGAEKLEYKCPTPECKEAVLVLLGSLGDEQEDKPSLKRSKKRKAVVPTVAPDLDITDMNEAFIDADDVDVDEEEDDDEAELEEDDVVVKVVVPVDDDVADDEALLDDDETVDDEEDDTFTDALDIGGDSIGINED